MRLEQGQCLHPQGPMLWGIPLDVHRPGRQHPTHSERGRLPRRTGRMGHALPCRFQNLAGTDHTRPKPCGRSGRDVPNFMVRRPQWRLDHALSAHRHRVRLRAMGCPRASEHLLPSIQRVGDGVARRSGYVCQRHPALHLHRRRRLRRGSVEWSGCALRHHKHRSSECHSL